MKKSILLFLYTISLNLTFGQWQPINEGFATVSINTMCLNESTNNIYIGTNKGIYKSTDYAETWSEIEKHQSLTPKDISVINDSIYVVSASTSGLYFIPENSYYDEQRNGGNNSITSNVIKIYDDKIYLGCDDGLYISSDYGRSFEAASNSVFDNQYGIYSIDINDDYIFAGTWSGKIFVSEFNGLSWRDLSDNLTGASVNKIFIGDNNTYACTDNLYRLSDNGEEWIELFSNPTWPSDFKINDIIVRGTTIYIATSNGFFRSVNNGVSWTESNEGLTNLFVNSIVLNNGRLFAGTSSGVYISIDGVNWNEANTNLPFSTPNDIHKVDERIFVATTGGGVLYRDENDSSWHKPILNPYYTSINKIVNIQDTVFASTWGEGILKSNDFGLTWNKLNSQTSQTITSITTNQNSIYYANHFAIYTSDNTGNEWDKIYFSSNSNPSRDVAVTDSAIFTTHEGNLYYSIDDGENWITKISDEYLRASIIRVHKGVIIIATTNGNIYTSNNYGDSWKLANSNYMSSIGDILFSNEYIFVGADNGIFISNDNAENFHQFDTESSDNLRDVYSIEIDSNYLYAGNPDGIFKQELSEIINQLNIPTPLVDFSQKVNSFLYPNPSSGVITLNNSTEILSLDIYNSTGIIVFQTKAIEKDETINLSHLAKGCYFIIYKTKNTISNDKLLIQ